MSKQIGVVIGSFHLEQGQAMLAEVQQYAQQADLKIAEVLWVPGSMEKPLALKRLLMSETIDAAVVLGIIEKGETRHGLVMAQAAIAAIIDLQLAFMKPVGVGILGPDIAPSQIPCRVRPYALAAVKAAHHMLLPDQMLADQHTGSTP